MPAARSTRRGCGRGQLDSTDSWTAHVRSVLLHLRLRLLYKAVFNAFSRTERLHVLVQTVVGPRFKCSCITSPSKRCLRKENAGVRLPRDRFCNLYPSV